MLNRNLRIVVVGAALAGALALSLPAAAKDKPARPRLSLQTVYLQERIGSARRVVYVGELGGRGKLTLDPNTCAVDAFGDARICTEIAARSIDVEMRQAKLADPSGKGRRLYRLVGAVPKGTAWFLVIPRRRSEPHRLVVDLGAGHRRTITLEHWTRPTPPPKPKPTALCNHAKYTAERKGSRIVIRARGEHPALGYKTHFERLPIRIFPPQFRLVCEPPKGMAGAMMTPFAVEASFDAGGTAVREVIVHDARGSHKVPVP